MRHNHKLITEITVKLSFDVSMSVLVWIKKKKNAEE